MDFQKFYMGEIYDAYRYLGAHVEQDGVVFRTFAPQAERVTIIFTAGTAEWSTATPMDSVWNCGRTSHPL